MFVSKILFLIAVTWNYHCLAAYSSHDTSLIRVCFPIETVVLKHQNQVCDRTLIYLICHVNEKEIMKKVSLTIFWLVTEYL